MIKRSYIPQLSYNITDAEKAEGEKSLLAFDSALKALNKALDHLHIMLTPWKDNPDISTEEIIEFRAALRRFRDKLIENFDVFKVAAFKCIVALKPFSLYTETSKLTKSFVSSIDELEDYVNKFAELFDNLKDKNLVQSVVSTLTSVDNQSEQIKKMIEDRIKTYIQKDILGKTWMDGITDDLQIQIEQKTPKLIELEQEREKQIHEMSNNNHATQNWQV